MKAFHYRKNTKSLYILGAGTFTIPEFKNIQQDFIIEGEPDWTTIICPGFTYTSKDYSPGIWQKSSGKTLTVRNCVIADFWGDGVRSDGNLILDHCWIVMNGGNGVRCNGSLAMTRCLVEQNGINLNHNQVYTAAGTIEKSIIHDYGNRGYTIAGAGTLTRNSIIGEKLVSGSWITSRNTVLYKNPNPTAPFSIGTDDLIIDFDNTFGTGEACRVIRTYGRTLMVRDAPPTSAVGVGAYDYQAPPSPHATLDNWAAAQWSNQGGLMYSNYQNPLVWETLPFFPGDTLTA